MMAYALAENGAAKVYIIGRRQNILVETAQKYPGYSISLFHKQFHSLASLCLKR